MDIPNPRRVLRSPEYILDNLREIGCARLVWPDALERFGRALHASRAWRLAALGLFGLGIALVAGRFPRGIEDHHPFIAFFPYVVVAAWFGDAVDGLVAVLFSAVAAGWIAALWPDTRVGDLAAEAVFVAGAFLLVALVHRLRAALRAAEEAMHVRDLVLAAVSHDLKTPLMAILGQAEIAARRLERADSAVERLRQPLAAVRESARRLRTLVDEITDLAHAQTGRLELCREEVDLGHLVLGAIDEVTSGAASGVPVVVEDAGGVIVAADPGRLERVVQNVVSNAIKYTVGQEQVHVQVWRAGLEARVTVRDQGVGIPADECAQVFEPFYRAGTAGGVPGTGVGLWVARAIIAAHGGHIDLVSAVGEGTTVTLALPLVQRAEEDDGPVGFDYPLHERWAEAIADRTLHDRPPRA